MNFEIELKTEVVWRGKQVFSNEECLEIMDAVIGKMTGNNLSHWANHGKYAEHVKDALK
jgi:hypothetical protein